MFELRHKSLPSFYLLTSLETPTSILPCDIRHQQRGNLNKHIRSIHRKERNFSCDQCDATFPFRNGLKEHVRMRHTDERPYGCNKCPSSFKKKSHLHRHSALVHKGAPWKHVHRWSFRPVVFFVISTQRKKTLCLVIRMTTHFSLTCLTTQSNELWLYDTSLRFQPCPYSIPSRNLVLSLHVEWLWNQRFLKEKEKKKTVTISTWVASVV